MTEQELRALVREAVGRHLGRPQHSAPSTQHEHAARSTQHEAPSTRQPDFSHSLYIELVNVTDACVIEPAVNCDHCGYCRSHGH
jgi:hypothetical protein